MAIRRNANRGVNSPFFDWLEKYWLMLLGVIFFMPTVMKWIKDINVVGVKDDLANSIEVNNAQNSVDSPIIIKDKVDQYLRVELKLGKADRDMLTAEAVALAHHFGYSVEKGDWYDFLKPRGWTENDDEIEKILKRQTYNFKIIERLYYMAYTQSRNLSSDILKNLDKANLQRVRSHWAKHNKSYL